MYNGYMEYDGVEVLNSTRTKAYVDALLPGVVVKCAPVDLHVALNHNPYTNPRNDAAPWYNALRPASAYFYGFFPTKIQGADDSTQETNKTELLGDGAVFVSPRHSSLEIRVVMTAIAKTEEAMADGIAWLRDVLDNSGCIQHGDCTGAIVRMFTGGPSTTGEAAIRSRYLYRVTVQEGPKVTREYPSQAGVMRAVEFTLDVGIPWLFTALTNVASLNMNSALNFTDPAGENCSVSTEAADNFINDPFFTAISAAPQPPNILPPNIIAISSWRRLTAPIGDAYSTRPGRVSPVITVVAGSSYAQYIRLRFYSSGAGLSGCDFSGEFFISYLPANAVMYIDGIRKEITVTLSDGRVVPGSHLVYGSGGRPFMWADLSCNDTYTMTADMFPGQTGIVVNLDVAVRE